MNMFACFGPAYAKTKYYDFRYRFSPQWTAVEIIFRQGLPLIMSFVKSYSNQWASFVFGLCFYCVSIERLFLLSRALSPCLFLHSFDDFWFFSGCRTVNVRSNFISPCRWIFFSSEGLTKIAASRILFSIFNWTVLFAVCCLSAETDKSHPQDSIGRSINKC